MSQKFVQTQAIALYSGLSGVATSMIVTPYPRDIQTNAKLTFTDFGTTPSLTIDPKIPLYEEICTFTGITDNGDDTATITGLIRNLIGQSPYTTPGTGKQHGSSAVVVFSDNPQMYARLASKDNDNVFTGINEGVAPTTSMGFVTRDYMLALINGGPITINSVIEAGIAGETLVAGNLVYFSEVDNEWLKTDADTLATVFNVKLGIAQGAGVNGGAITGGVLTYGTYTTSGLTQGDLVYASNTAGGFVSGTSGTTPRVIGIAKDSTTLYFDPNFQNMLYDYAVDAVGTDSYAVTLAGAYNAYYIGMPVFFKAGTANTTACTLNVNGLGAKTIKRDVTTDLVTGDILANQIVFVKYDGTNFQMISLIAGVRNAALLTGLVPAASLSTLDTTSGVGSGVASSSTQTITHGLGRIPKIVRITAIGALSQSSVSQTAGFSFGIYNSSGNKSVSIYGLNNSSDVVPSTNASASLDIADGDAGPFATAIINNVGATTFDIVWTATGSVARVRYIWEAE